MTTTPERSYRWLFWALALFGLAADQASKYVVFAWLYNDGKGDTRAIIPGPSAGVFYLDASFPSPPQKDPGTDFFSPLRTVGGECLPRLNHGALWGIGGRDGRDEPGTDYNSTFAIISVIAAVVLMLWSLRRKAAQEFWLCVTLGLILAGTLGNLYDRVVFGGVRDFLHWNYLFDFPVFNLADCCLVCGAFLLLVQAFYGQPDDPEPQTAVVETSLAEPAEPAAQRQEVAEAIQEN